MTDEPGEKEDAAEPAGAPGQQPAAKPKPGGARPVLYARAFDRLAAASTPPPRRGGLILLIVLLLLIAAGYGLWRMGRFDPLLATIGAGVERVAPMTGPLRPALERFAASLQGGSAQSETAMLTETKKLLAQLDFQPGPMDGALDDQTVSAIQAYQQAAGLPVDGKPSQALLDDLRAVAADQAPAKSN